MKALVYINEQKDIDKSFQLKLNTLLKEHNFEFSRLYEKDLKVVKDIKADVMFVLGGDGTILKISQLAGINNIPIIGINAGKIGFLTEFEKNDIELTLDLFLKGKLKEEKRIALLVNFNNKDYFCLNDCVVQRFFDEEHTEQILNVKVDIDNTNVDEIRGDGVIISTPTGSTAYSLSAGGPILAPQINAFAVTPMSAHSLHHRPIIYSADSVCHLTLIDNKLAGIVLDGKFVGILKQNDSITIKKSAYPIKFLRKIETNFYNRLVSKLNN